MIRPVPLLLTVAALAGCGARTGLEEQGDGSARPDSGPEDGAPATPTCRSLPNCIEAEITTPSGEVIDFASGGEVSVYHHMGRGAWLETPPDREPTMAVQLSLAASPGPVELTLNITDFYVDVRYPEASCNVRGEGRLDLVDLAPGGVNEGTFEGATRDDCDGGAHRVRRGWFRLTMP